VARLQMASPKDPQEDSAPPRVGLGAGDLLLGGTPRQKPVDPPSTAPPGLLWPFDGSSARR